MSATVIPPVVCIILLSIGLTPLLVYLYLSLMIRLISRAIDDMDINCECLADVLAHDHVKLMTNIGSIDDSVVFYKELSREGNNDVLLVYTYVSYVHTTKFNVMGKLKGIDYCDVDLPVFTEQYKR